MHKMLAIVLGGATAAMAALTTYPAPQGAALNNAYTVRVREPGGAWQDLAEYRAEIDMHRRTNTSFVYFDCSGPVEVSVTRNGGSIQNARIRPLSRKLTPAVSGNALTFTLPGPAKVSVEVNGDIFQNLQVFANPIETLVPDRADPNVTWLGPGIHNGNRTVGSGKILYLAGGAILNGSVSMNNAQNARLLGRGIINRPPGAGISVNFSNQVTIDGVIVVNSGSANNGGYVVGGGQSNNFTIRNFKAFSAHKWGDGLDFMSCTNVTIDDVFMRTSDDCIAIYGHRWDFRGNVKNFRVMNSILWADVAHTINIGTHGDTRAEGEILEDLVFTNLDILEHDEPQVDYQGTMTITDGDKNLVRNVRFEDIRVEDFDRGQLLNLKVVYNSKYNTAPGRGIENIHFKNITYNGVGENASQIAGYDAARMVKGVTFENLRINGRLILDAASGNINVGPHTQDIRFLPPGTSPALPRLLSSPCAPRIQGRSGGWAVDCPCAGGYRLELLGGDGRKLNRLDMSGPGKVLWAPPVPGGRYLYRFRLPGGAQVGGFLHP